MDQLLSQQELRREVFDKVAKGFNAWALFDAAGCQVSVVPDTLPRYVVITYVPSKSTEKTAPPFPVLRLSDTEDAVGEAVDLAIRGFTAYGGYFDLDEIPLKHRVGAVNVQPDITGYQPPRNPDLLIPPELVQRSSFVRLRQRENGGMIDSPDKIFRVERILENLNGPRTVIIADEHVYYHVTDSMLVALTGPLLN